MTTKHTPGRRFVDAPQELRCMQTIRLNDGTTAQCGRLKKIGEFCTQHARKALAKARS